MNAGVDIVREGRACCQFHHEYAARRQNSRRAGLQVVPGCAVVRRVGEDHVKCLRRGLEKRFDAEGDDPAAVPGGDPREISLQHDAYGGVLLHEGHVAGPAAESLNAQRADAGIQVTNALSVPRLQALKQRLTNYGLGRARVVAGALPQFQTPVPAGDDDRGDESRSSMRLNMTRRRYIPSLSCPCLSRLTRW